MRTAILPEETVVALDKRVTSATTDLVIAVNPLFRPSARFVLAAVRAGCLGVLDLSVADRSAREELARADEWTTTTSFGVRLGSGSPFTDAELPSTAGVAVTRRC